MKTRGSAGPPVGVATSSYLSQEVDYRTQQRDEAQGALVEAERHAALGRLAAGVGHEINNPLTYLRLNVELIGEWADANSPCEELRESVESALDGADRIRRVVDALRAYSLADTGERRAMAPEDFVHSALRMSFHPPASQRNGAVASITLTEGKPGDDSMRTSLPGMVAPLRRTRKTPILALIEA